MPTNHPDRDLKRAARAHATAHNVSYTAALRAVSQTSDALPRHVLFPTPGSSDFARAEASAHHGVLVLGQSAEHGPASMDLTTCPHWLLSGATGTGKSQTLTIPLFWALWLPKTYQVYLVDPVGEFSWAAGMPNVHYGSTPDEITETITAANEHMTANLRTLIEHGVDNLGQLRSRTAGKLDRPDPPRRALLIIDKLRLVMNGGDRAWVDKILMLGRAPGVNVIAASQETTARSGIFPDLFSGHIGHGNRKPLRTIADTDPLVDQIPRKVPKGRAWILSDGQPDRLTQIAYLPHFPGTLHWANGQPHHPGVSGMLAITPPAASRAARTEGRLSHRPE